MNLDRKALIFNIVRSSFVDGPGIRTTVFLKGCPLRCVWCCNPEGQSFAQELKITSSKCNGCSHCIDVCPKGALSLKAGKAQADRSLCDGCGKCLNACWHDALGLWGTLYTAEELFSTIKGDIPFFKVSDGGLTIGGGEATCFPEFCLELIGLCHAEGINVAIDSCGYVLTDSGRKVYAEADLILLDIKGITEERHIENTGVSNGPILQTLDWLNSIGKTVIIRVPVIPEYNGDLRELALIAEHISRYNCVQRIDLIPYHEFGKTKYEQLDREYQAKTHKISTDEQNIIQELFSSYGLYVQIGG